MIGLVPLGRLVEQLRMVKDETELALLARACAITCEAFTGTLSSIVPGRSERELAILLERAMIEALGHSVGLQVHETPIIGYGRTGTLAKRVAITIEPGIRLPGKGGAGIEDTLVVRAGPGPAEILTTATRELLVL